LREALLSPLDEPAEPTAIFQGVTENVGNGGICMVSKQLFLPNSVLRCELAIPGNSVGIPTLMQVRWVAKIARTRRYRIGLSFLL
jgi:hypothetical protein